jgi:hypothetical protein
MRGETPGIAIAASDAPMTRTARRRGIGSASVRARSSKKRSALTFSPSVCRIGAASHQGNPYTFAIDQDPLVRIGRNRQRAEPQSLAVPRRA